MKIRHALAHCAAATLIAPAAFAATTQVTEDCARCRRRWIPRSAANGTGSSIAKARDHEAKGEKLCNVGQEGRRHEEVWTRQRRHAVKAK